MLYEHCAQWHYCAVCDRFRMVSTFFFYGLLGHRDLHSFPTRRSSDLRFQKRARRSWCRPLAYLPGCHLNAIQPRQIRSEEHTSEFQSHVNLVCRLLLEKKKMTP